MKELFKAIDEKIRKLIVSETEKGNNRMNKKVKQAERSLVKLEKRLTFLEQEFFAQLTSPPKKDNSRKIRLKATDISVIRLRFKLTQADFARLLGTDRATLNRWEHGKVKPNQKSKAKIAEFRTMGKKEFSRRMKQVEDAIWK